MSEQEKKMKMKIKVDFFCNISHDTHNMCDRLRPCGLMDHNLSCLLTMRQSLSLNLHSIENLYQCIAMCDFTNFLKKKIKKKQYPQTTGCEKSIGPPYNAKYGLFFYHFTQKLCKKTTLLSFR